MVEPGVYQCICGHAPETVVTYRMGARHFLTKCVNCQMVYVNGPSKTLEHSLEMWNSYLRESVKLIMGKMFDQIPELQNEIAHLRQKEG